MASFVYLGNFGKDGMLLNSDDILSVELAEETLKGRPLYSVEFRVRVETSCDDLGYHNVIRSGTFSIILPVGEDIFYGLSLLHRDGDTLARMMDKRRY